jgi:hypothetical protein
MPISQLPLIAAGQPQSRYTMPGIFVTPHSAAFDSDGNIYVVEWLPYARVTKLNKVTA